MAYELYESKNWCDICQAWTEQKKIRHRLWVCQSCKLICDGLHPLDRNEPAPAPTERFPKGSFKKSPHRQRRWSTTVSSRSATVTRYRRSRFTRIRHNGGSNRGGAAHGGRDA